MKFYFKDMGVEAEVTLRLWDGNGRNPDVFGELETGFPMEHPERREGDDAVVCNFRQFMSMYDWWEEEVKRANENPDWEGDGLCGRNHDATMGETGIWNLEIIIRS